MAENFDSNLDDEKERLKIQKAIKQSIKDNVNGLEDMAKYGANILKNWNDLRKVNKDIAKNQKEINDLLERAKTASKEEAEILQKRAAAIGQENEQLKKQADQLKAINKEMASKGNLMRGMFNAALNYAKQGLSSYLEFDQKTRDVAATIGLTNDRMYQMRREIDGARAVMIGYGYSVDDAVAAQSAYAEQLGRSVVLSESALENMAQVAKATGLGMEGVAGMASEMELFGYGAEDASKFIKDMYAESTAMGLNAGKVSKKFQQNLNLLNKLNFKSGAKGLKELTKISEKFKIDMQGVASAASKLSKLEDAIDAAANLQVMGGELAALGDPFQLMYKARNAPEELAKSITKAAKASATFNDKTGEFEVNANELDRLRHSAEALNMDYESLVETAKQGAKIEKFSGLLSGKGIDPETSDAIAMMSEMKDGKAQINFIDKNGVRIIKDLKSITKEEALSLKQQKKDAEEAAKQATGVKQQYEALFNNMITALWPLFERLMPLIKKAADSISGWLTSNFDRFQHFLENFGKDFDLTGTLNYVAEIGKNLMTSIKNIVSSPLVKAITSFVSNNAGWLVGIGLLVKYLGPMLSPISWYLKGISLGKGFNASQTGGGGVLGKLFGGKTPTPAPTTPLSGAQTAMQGQAAKGAGMGSMMKSFGSAAQILAVGAALMMVAKSVEILANAALIIKNNDLGGTMVGLLVGISAFVALMGVLGSTGIGEAAILVIDGIGLGMLMIGGAVWLVAQGMTSVVDAFTRMFTILPTAGTQLLLAGAGFMAMATGISVLTLSLIGLGAASLLALPGLMILGSATNMLVGAAESLSSAGGGGGIEKSINAINSVDTNKLEALKELSLFMSLLGASPTIKFDESLKVDGTIQLAGQGGSKNTDWVSDPIFVNKLKQLISQSMEKEKNGGKAR